MRRVVGDDPVDQSDREPYRTTRPDQEAIQRALESGGVSFTPKDANRGEGIRIKLQRVFSIVF